MSQIVIQNRWDNGEAEDIRTTNQYQGDTIRNFDIFTEPFRLNPLLDSAADSSAVAMDDIRITDVVNGYITSTGLNYIVGIGYKQAASNNIGFFIKSAGDYYGVWSAVQASTVTSAFVPGSGVTYKTQAYAVDWNGSTTYRLIRFTDFSNAENLGSITAPFGSTVKTFVHPEDNILYIVIGNVIAKWDGSTLTSVTTILPANFDVASLTNYGTFLIIAMNPTYEQKAVAYLWGRDMTLNTLQGTIDLGQSVVAIAENIDDNLFFIMSSYSRDASIGDFVNKIVVKRYNGAGAEEVIQLFENITAFNGAVLTYKAKRNNKLFFVMTASPCVYKFGKNKQGVYVLTEDRYVQNGTTGDANRNISIVNNVMWVGVINGSTYSLRRTSNATDYTSTSVYKTTINPNMAVEDRYRLKQLESVQLSVTGSAAGTYVVKYSIDGSAMATIISESTSSVVTISKEALSENSGAVFLNGREITFQIETTGNVKPIELKYRYEVLNSPT